jgi:hypothetical protein
VKDGAAKPHKYSQPEQGGSDEREVGRQEASRTGVGGCKMQPTELDPAARSPAGRSPRGPPKKTDGKERAGGRRRARSIIGLTAFPKG